MFLGRREDVQCRSVGGIASSFSIELLPKSAKIRRLVVHNQEHSAEEEKIARLHCLDVSAKARRGGWELNAKVPQPVICTHRCEALMLTTGRRAHRRPRAAPPR